jgi:hypothetical protein
MSRNILCIQHDAPEIIPERKEEDPAKWRIGEIPEMKPASFKTYKFRRNRPGREQGNGAF